VCFGLADRLEKKKQKRKETTHTMKRTIEIDDTLDNRVESAIEDIKSELQNYLKENPDTDSLPCLNNDLDYSGAIHSIVDSSVPVYTHEIKTAWYLHGSELEEAYENAGVGDNPMENDGMSAIYFFIMEKVQEWYSENAEEVFEEWKESKK
jgi:hypothetical protein